jgi:hypothetical protein
MHRGCRGGIRCSHRGGYAFAKYVIHPSIDCVEGLGIFHIQCVILCSHIRQTSPDSCNIFPNLCELTRLDIVDGSFEGHTPSDFLTELQNGLSILCGGLQ